MNRHALWLPRVRHAHFYHKDFSTKVERTEGGIFQIKYKNLPVLILPIMSSCASQKVVLLSWLMHCGYLMRLGYKA